MKRNAFLVNKDSGEVVNYIVADDEQTYVPDVGLMLVFPQSPAEEIEKAAEYSAE